MGRKHWDPRVPQHPIWPEFVMSYIEAAIWSSSDDEGPLDERYSGDDFTQAAMDRALTDSNDFIASNLKDLNESGGTPAQHGADFWLTRNRHGAGLWDRGYGAIGKRLTEAAHAYGEIHVYAGDDDKLHFMQG